MNKYCMENVEIQNKSYDELTYDKIQIAIDTTLVSNYKLNVITPFLIELHETSYNLITGLLEIDKRLDDYYFEYNSVESYNVEQLSIDELTNEVLKYSGKVKLIEIIGDDIKVMEQL